MIFKVARFIFRMFLGIGLGIAMVVWFFAAIIGWIRSGEPREEQMSYVIKDYETCAKYPEGTYLACPICNTTFYKHGTNCCSAKCEHKYHEMKTAWDKAQAAEKELNKLGKKYK